MGSVVWYVILETIHSNQGGIGLGLFSTSSIDIWSKLLVSAFGCFHDNILIIKPTLVISLLEKVVDGNASYFFLFPLSLSGCFCLSHL